MNNLIGISGKMNAGKDLIGNIITHLINPSYCNSKTKELYDDFYMFPNRQCDWEIKKFADKLKDIVCLLVGCSREYLEDRYFKESELGEEWWYYTFPNTNIKELCTVAQFNRLHENQQSWGKLHKPTPRTLLQLLGTQCGRDIIHPDIWVNALFADFVNPVKMDDRRSKSKWIITDVRFPNEAKKIKEKGGILIRINRPKVKVITDDLVTDIIHNSKNFGIVEHESETALDNYKEFDFIIENNGTIEELVEKVKQII